MFTNWLTGGGSSSSSSSGSRTTATTTILPASTVTACDGGGSTGSVITTPPDVILEVGPATASVRFVAHALVLGMHSGYLRSAIRLDEAAATAATLSSAGELILYLSNVTAEQFAPLLTYMYTGFLDLNVDNIFAVLLATHVLHMPRALEICRSFLARAQTEGFLNSSNSGSSNTSSSTVGGSQLLALSGSKIIRPIASKATVPNLGFLPLPPLTLPPTAAAAAAAAAAVPYKCTMEPGYAATPTTAATPQLCLQPAAELLPALAEQPAAENDDDEDVEVFIDSSTVSDNEADDTTVDAIGEANMDSNVSVVSSLDETVNIERLDTQTPQQLQLEEQQTKPAAAAAKPMRSTRKRKSSGMQVAKAPISAAKLELSSVTLAAATAAVPSKFIIDVASCDGPVRFRRILNTAYGHKPEAFESASDQRTQQSVSYSFHQQMAKTISSQQRQQLQQQAEESENSSGDAAAAQPVQHRKHQQQQSAATAAQSHELYVCVYCKHTFKSQYCYQKHAKRHLNPLSLAEKSLNRNVAAATQQQQQQLQQPHQQQQQQQQQQQTVGSQVTTDSTRTQPPSTGETLLRREVRPLDMNVQYYPCKTCGSKFPSYYFVHKHRKLCHADEVDNVGSTATATATATATVTAATSTTTSSLSCNSAVPSTAELAASETTTPAAPVEKPA